MSKSGNPRRLGRGLDSIVSKLLEEEKKDGGRPALEGPITPSPITTEGKWQVGIVGWGEGGAKGVEGAPLGSSIAAVTGGPGKSGAKIDQNLAGTIEVEEHGKGERAASEIHFEVGCMGEQRVAGGIAGTGGGAERAAVAGSAVGEMEREIDSTRARVAPIDRERQGVPGGFVGVGRGSGGVPGASVVSGSRVIKTDNRSADSEPVRETNRSAARTSIEADERGAQVLPVGSSGETAQLRSPRESERGGQRPTSADSGGNLEGPGIGAGGVVGGGVSGGEGHVVALRRGEASAPRIVQGSATQSSHSNDPMAPGKGEPQSQSTSGVRAGEEIERTAGMSDESRTPALMVVSINALGPSSYQPRESMDEAGLRELAESIRQSGILQPIAVRRIRQQGSEATRQRSQRESLRSPAGEVHQDAPFYGVSHGGTVESRHGGTEAQRHGEKATSGAVRQDAPYEIIAGERRWQAAKLAGLLEVPVIVHDVSNDKMLELALVENLQREDLNAVDRARGYRRFCDEFRLTADHVARRVGEDRSTVANYLRLLELPDEVLGMLADGRLSQGHAKAILMEPEDSARVVLARLVVNEGLSVRKVEEVIRRGKGMLGPSGMGLRGGATGVALAKGKAEARRQSAHLRSLERRFEEALKTRVTIKEGKRKGSGKITIEYFSFDEFQGIMEAMGVEEE